MAIRCASKAIIINNGSILLNKCKNDDGRIYYDLPGGGQNVYESLEEALVREVKEETGYDVRVEKFIALAEEIYTSEELRKTFPEYTHRIFHVFKAELINDTKEEPTDTDYAMVGSEWIPLNNIELLKECCSYYLKKILQDNKDLDVPCYVGTEYKD